MIPYFAQPSLSLGPLKIHAFGALIALSVAVGDQILRRRVRTVGLDENTAASLAGWSLLGGFLFAHIFSLVLYFPERIVSDPMSILRVWDPISSFGGMIGGAGTVFLYLWIRRDKISLRERWGYLDAVAYTIPFAWAIGRIGCALAHDHPGRVTTVPLAISLEKPEAQALIARAYRSSGLPLPSGDLTGMGFHDLGWYEFLYLALFVVPLLLILDRRRSPASRPAAWWFGIVCLVYAPMRIGLDALRVVDRRYFGLTPGQIVAFIMLGLGLMLILRPPRTDGAATARPARA